MAGTPKKTPAKSPAKAKSPSPKKSGKKSPMKSAKKSPVKTPKKTPVKSPKVQKAIQKSPKEKKARSGKKVKDADAPKRNLSAYMLWLNDNRDNIIKEHNLPAGKVTEVMKKAGELWAKLGAEQKKPYEEQSAKDKVRYEKEKEGYTPSEEFLAKKAAAKASKGKKAKKEKDENAPKKATTAYFFYLKSNRDKIIKEFSLDAKKVAEVAKKAGELWGRLSEAEKKPYADEAAKDKVRFDKELAAYNAA